MNARRVAAVVLLVVGAWLVIGGVAVLNRPPELVAGIAQAMIGAVCLYGGWRIWRPSV